MQWVTLAQGTSLEEFRAYQPPFYELSKGTKMRLTIETPWWLPVAPFFDIFGAEWVAQRLLVEGGAIVTDVEGVGWHKIIVHCKADPAWVVPLIIAITVIAGGALTIIALIKLEALIPAIPPPVSWGFLFLAVAALIYVVRGRKVREEAKVTDSKPG